MAKKDDYTDIEDLDMYYFDQWKKTKNKDSFQKLYRGMGGLINEASKKAAMGSNIPQSVFKLEAAQQFHDALERFDPSKGVKLKSYIYGTVQDKLKRVNYEYANIGRIPERSGQSLGVYHVNAYQNTKEFLKQKLNREPSAMEIAEEMKVSVSEVEGLSKEIRKDLSLNAMLEDLASFDEFAAEKDKLAMYYFDMTPIEQNVYDYATGSHGKQAMLKTNGQADFTAIARKLNLGEKEMRKIRANIIKQLKD